MTLEVRPVRAEDDGDVFNLLQASLGWLPDEDHRAFFAWKHRDNPFGVSPSWVAVDGERVVGFRTFMRWDFERPDGVAPAVRAVDTATHPDYQGRGLFSKLTLNGLEELREEGVRFVFNTPNDQSRPGYLKMGWQVVGRLPVLARPRSSLAFLKLARARTRAERWPVATDAGEPATTALADVEPVAKLLAQQSPVTGLRTHRTPEYLHWRYGRLPMLGYRVVTAGRVEDGLAVFRLRRRGALVECTICEVLVPEGERHAATELARQALLHSGADYAIQLGGRRAAGKGFLPIPRQGPRLTWRSVCEPAMPSFASWELAVGDIELF